MRLLLKNRSFFYLGVFVILALALVGTAIAALADSGTGATAVVNAGNLNVTGSPSVSATPVTLDGIDHTTTYTLGLMVTDYSGTGSGWHLTISATTFTTGTSPNIHTLSTSASTIMGVAVSCAGLGTCTDPTGTH